MIKCHLKQAFFYSILDGGDRVFLSKGDTSRYIEVNDHRPCRWLSRAGTTTPDNVIRRCLSRGPVTRLFPSISLAVEPALIPIGRTRRTAVTFHRSISDSKLQQFVSAQQQCCFTQGVGPSPPRPTTDNVSGFVHK